MKFKTCKKLLLILSVTIMILQRPGQEAWTQQQQDELTYILNKVDFPYMIVQ